MINKTTGTFFICILFFGLISCSGVKGDMLIPEEKLKAVIFDFHSAEYIINRAPSDLKDSLRQVYQFQIFKIHEVEKQDFMHDLEILQDNPNEFFKFYEEVEKYGLDLKSRTLSELKYDVKKLE
jgi:hypothetical protein